MFRDRHDAGVQLAKALLAFRDTAAVVLALPRGGVPVASEVAKQLGLPLDVLICRKLGVPGHEEFAFGAIAEGGVRYIDSKTARSLGLTQLAMDRVYQEELGALEERIQKFRGNSSQLSLRGKTALIIDDGLATGATARAACLAARNFGAERVVVAVPVGPGATEHSLPEADEVICLDNPAPFLAVGNHYENFDQVEDAEVIQILKQAKEPI
jgi:putative phosphoribosyl transferase